MHALLLMDTLRHPHIVTHAPSTHPLITHAPLHSLSPLTHHTGSLTLSLCTLDTRDFSYSPTLPHTHPKVSPEHSHELSHHFHYLIVRVGVVGEPRGLTDCDDGDVHPPAVNTHQQHAL